MTVGQAAKTISHRELRNNSGEVLRAVAAGESFIVTNNGEPVAELRPVNVHPFGGLNVTPPRTTGGFSQIAKWHLSRPVLEILDDLRSDK